MKKYRQMVVAGCVVTTIALGAFSARALQRAEQAAPPTLAQVLPRNFTVMHTKILEMVRDFPEDKFDFRPQKDVRSFLEEVWHVTAVVQLIAARATGEKVDVRQLFSNEGKPREREALAAALEKAMRDAAAHIERNPDPQFISTCTHAAEHYGHLAGIYRSAGLVPPASRPGYKGVAFDPVMRPTPPPR